MEWWDGVMGWSGVGYLVLAAAACYTADEALAGLDRARRAVLAYAVRWDVGAVQALRRVGDQANHHAALRKHAATRSTGNLEDGWVDAVFVVLRYLLLREERVLVLLARLRLLSLERAGRRVLHEPNFYGVGEEAAHHGALALARNGEDVVAKRETGGATLRLQGGCAPETDRGRALLVEEVLTGGGISRRRQEESEGARDV